jgi:hypothetical protein
MEIPKKKPFSILFKKLPIHVVHIILIGFLGGNAAEAMLRAMPKSLYAAIKLTNASPIARSISIHESRARMIDAVVYDHDYARFIKFYLRIADNNRAKLKVLRLFDIVFIGDDTAFTGDAILIRVYPTSVVFAVMTPSIESALNIGNTIVIEQFLVYRCVERMRYLYRNALKSARFSDTLANSKALCGNV